MPARMYPVPVKVPVRLARVLRLAVDPLDWGSAPELQQCHHREPVELSVLVVALVLPGVGAARPGVAASPVGGCRCLVRMCHSCHRRQVHCLEVRNPGLGSFVQCN
ncbi:hypothetical protein D3C85_1524260 [compost metagenome]